MKKFGTLAFVFVLTAAMLAGCRSQNNSNATESSPTILPTVEMPTIATTEETTVPTTMPTEAPTEESTETVGEDGMVGGETTESSENGAGNGASDQGGAASDNGGAAGGARSMPGVR